MESIYSLKKFNLKNTLISIIISFHLFFWDIKIINIYGFGESITYGFREAIIFVYVFIIYDLCKNNFFLLKNNKKNIFIISLFVSIIFFHQYINSYFDQVQLTFHNILGILGIYSLLLLLYFYYKLIIKNLKFIINFFLFILFITYFFSEWRPSSQWEVENLCNTKFQFLNKYIFLENSHLGMIIGPTVGYLLYYFKDKNIIYYYLIYLFIFFLFYLEYSTTLFFSIIVSFLIILLIDYKLFFKRNLIFIIFILISFNLLNSHEKCLFKFKHTAVGTNVMIKDKIKNFIDDNDETLLKVQNLILKHSQLEKELSSGDLDKKKFAEKYKEYSVLNEIIKEVKAYIDFVKNKKDLEKIINDINSDKDIKELALSELEELIKNNELNEKKIKLFLLPKDEKKNFIYDKYESISKNIKYDKLPKKTHKLKFNLSSAVFINSIEISYETLTSRYLGWGLNRYENAFDYYMFNQIVIPYFYHEVYTLNYNDGSANISKLTTEFGWLILIFFPIFLFFLFSKKIPNELKIFFVSLIITQLIRGAGYFNGGFAFSLIFVLFTVFNFFEKNYEK